MIHEGIINKSIVLIKKQDFIESNGDKILVRLDNGKVVLKRAYKKNNLFILQSETDNYYPIVCNYSDIQSGYVKIIGKAIKVETNL
jgi:SOS-response transcriptional repressor LexA